MLALTILASGSTNPTAERFGSSFLLSIDDERLMFDCGPAATAQLVRAGVRPTEVDHLLFTHHHYDHDVDYPCFLLCRWDQGAGQSPTLGRPDAAGRALDPVRYGFDGDVVFAEQLRRIEVVRATQPSGHGTH